MRISSITPTSVWGASSRSLTNIGSGALASSSIVLATIAANTNVDLRTSAGIVGDITIGAQTGAGATAAIQLQNYDGTNQIPVATTAAGSNATIGWHQNNTSSVGLRVANLDATHVGNYITSAKVWTI